MESNALAETRTLDDKGRLNIEEMTDRELLQELVQSTRMLNDALEAASKNPMLSMLLPKGF